MNMFFSFRVMGGWMNVDTLRALLHTRTLGTDVDPLISRWTDSEVAEPRRFSSANTKAHHGAWNWATSTHSSTFVFLRSISPPLDMLLSYYHSPLNFRFSKIHLNVLHLPPKWILCYLCKSRSNIPNCSLTSSLLGPNVSRAPCFQKLAYCNLSWQ